MTLKRAFNTTIRTLMITVAFVLIIAVGPHGCYGEIAAAINYICLAAVAFHVSQHTAITTHLLWIMHFCWLHYNVILTDWAVSSRPAGQTFTVTISVVACGVVGTVDTHFRAMLAIIASWTNCNTRNATCKMTCTSLGRDLCRIFLFEISKAYSNI